MIPVPTSMDGPTTVHGRMAIYLLYDERLTKIGLALTYGVCARAQPANWLTIFAAVIR